VTNFQVTERQYYIHHGLTYVNVDSLKYFEVNAAIIFFV